MDWNAERYVRIYTRDTADWKMLPWQSQALFLFMLRKADRAGVIQCNARNATVTALARLVDMPIGVVRRALPHLLSDGCVRECDEGYVIPNYLAAQEAAKSNAQRQKEFRERRRAQALGEAHNDVTPVTARYADVTGVTKSNPVPSLAVPNLKEQRGRHAKEDPPWLSEACALWAEIEGMVAPRRMRLALSRLIADHGWPVVRAAAELYLRAKQAKGTATRPEWFREEAVRWIKLSQAPVVDPDGVLTPEAERLTRPA